MKLVLAFAVLFGISSLAIVSQGLAGDTPPPTLASIYTADPTCSISPLDPFEPALRFNTGVNSGKCANTGEMRSIQYLTEAQQEAYRLPEGKKYFSNFLHNGKFWIAAIDPKDIQDVTMVTESFPAAVPAAHTMLRFILKPGKNIDLTEQVTNLNPAHAQVHEFMTSDEAIVGRNGAPYGLVQGLKPNFGFAYRIASTETKYDWIVKTAHHPTSQVKLKLSNEEKQKCVTQFLDDSNKGGLADVYQTIKWSCTTELFKGLDDCAPRSGLLRKIELHALETAGMQTYPVSAEKALEIRGLTDKNSRMPSIDKDPSVLAEVQPPRGNAATPVQKTATATDKTNIQSRAPLHPVKLSEQSSAH